jgi:Fe2+ or Zn2+ uptake regulation protein
MVMDDLVATGLRRLRSTGKRITPQRRLVLSILAGSDQHLDAHDIYDRGRRQDVHLSLATVYRTLNLLKETGVVHELHLDDEHHHYELDDKDEHSHLVCLGCGKVIEVDGTLFADAAMAAGEACGFEIASTRVELTGYCLDCARRDK